LRCQAISRFESVRRWSSRPSSGHRVSLSARVLLALCSASGRQLRGLREISREVERWRAFAKGIPDDALRHDALEAIERKRQNIDGAALFWTLPRVRSLDLLRLLIAYEILADYLDCTSERGAYAGTRNGLQLHRALTEALDPTLPISDYYRHHPWSDDGGFAHALIETCRSTCPRLPSYEVARPLVIRAASLTQVLALNHEPDPARRDTALRAWAKAHFSDESELTWFEWTAGASAWLTILALLALAAESDLEEKDAAAIYAAYLPWVSLTGTMLDSYGDAVEDTANTEHSYIAHYATAEAAAKRLTEIVRRCIEEAGSLRHGQRHMVVVSAMTAMYLSKDAARTPENRAFTSDLAQAGGRLTQLLMPVLRAWRILYGHERHEYAGYVVNQTRRPSRNHAIRRADPALPPSAPLPSAIQTLAFWRHPHAYLEWCQRRYGSRFTINPIGMPPLVFMSDPADIKAIVRAPAEVLHPGAGANVIAPLVGEGSFMLVEEDKHLTGRRAILPAFKHRVIEDHTAMIKEIAAREIAAWPLNMPVAIHPYLRALSLRVILRTVFGNETARLQDLHTKLLAMLSVTASLALQEPQLRRLPGWSGIWRRFLADRADVDRIISGLIDDEAHAPARESGLLSMLIGESDTDIGKRCHQQIRDDIMSVILAGHETTASELAWAFQLLAHHRTVMSRLVDDLDDGGEHYLIATVQEVLRHRPVFLFAIPRVVHSPFELSGITYRPPVHLVACIYLMQHDPVYYTDPEQFRPERFLSTEPPGELWMPWGGGRKRCPGHHLATLEMRTVLRLALSELEVTAVGRTVETARWRSVIVTPGHGSRIVLRKRTATKGGVLRRAPSTIPSGSQGLN
jgi:cytochrome P450